MRDTEIIDEVVAYYENKLACFGTTAQGVDWKDHGSHRERFTQLVRALGIDAGAGHFTILDFGCGYGALLPFLAESGFEFSYTGYDRSPAMIEAARQEHAIRANAVFTTDWDVVPSADYVVASGVFNVRMATPREEWEAYVLRTLALIDQKATHGWAANFLTSYADEDRKRADLYYAEPGMVFDWCQRSATRWVSLLHDYALYEFTIGVMRRPR